MRIYFESENSQPWIAACIPKLNAMMQGKKWMLLVRSRSSQEIEDVKKCKTSAAKTLIRTTKKGVQEALEKYPNGKLVVLKSKNDFDLLHSFFDKKTGTAETESLTHHTETAETIRVAVVLVCHEAYLKFLPDAVRSIQRQAVHADEKVLVLDGCEAPAHLNLEGWEVIKGSWANPNPARNAGMQFTKSPWLIFFDADNVMAADYIKVVKKSISSMKAARNIGFFYPDLQYCDEQLRPTRLLRVPEFDYWHARECTAFDTSSAWRRSALDMISGWDSSSRAWDDFRLVLRLSRLGWRGQPLGHAVFMREHKVGVRRSMVDVAVRKTESFNFYSLTILTLLAGRKNTFEDLVKSLMELEIPAETSLHLVDNSGSTSFNLKLKQAVTLLMERYATVTVSRIGKPYKFKKDEPYLTFKRHFHVANLYAKLFQEINTDRLLTLEDDMVPPVDGLRKLSDELFVNSRIGAVAGTYRSGSHPDHACAAMDEERWYSVPRFEDVPKHPVFANFFGGGFTLYNMNAVRKSLPVLMHQDGSYIMGWDGYLCREMRRHGYRLVLHGGVRVQHNAWGLKKLSSQ